MTDQQNIARMAQCIIEQQQVLALQQKQIVLLHQYIHEHEIQLRYMTFGTPHDDMDDDSIDTIVSEHFRGRHDDDARTDNPN